MSAKVEIKNGNFQITIPVKEAYENRPVRNLVDILRGQDILSRSKATPEQIKELADEVTAAWWEKKQGQVSELMIDADLWTGDKKLVEGLRKKGYEKTIITADLLKTL